MQNKRHIVFYVKEKKHVWYGFVTSRYRENEKKDREIEELHLLSQTIQGKQVINMTVQ